MSELEERTPKRARVIVNRVGEEELDVLQLIPKTTGGIPGGTLQPATLFFSTNATFINPYSQNSGGLFVIWDSNLTGEVALLRADPLANAPVLEIGTNQTFGEPTLVPAAGEGGIYFEDGTNVTGALPGLSVYTQDASFAPWNTVGWKHVPHIDQGTWTLTVGDGTVNMSLGTSTSSNYQVVGNICHFSLRFRIDTGGKGAAVGAVRISLPFTSKSGSTNQAGVALGDYSFITFAASDNVEGRVGAANAYLRLFRCATAAMSVTIKIADMDDGVVPGVGRTQMRINGSYFID